MTDHRQHGAVDRGEGEWTTPWLTFCGLPVEPETYVYVRNFFGNVTCSDCLRQLTQGPDPAEPVAQGPTAGVQIIDRTVVQEVTRRDVAEWPEDERSQRAWCLDRSLAHHASIWKSDGDPIARAEEFRSYINTGAQPQPEEQTP